jgi:Ca2+:H+ antiporter
LPTFTSSRTGPEFSPLQLGFAATASLTLYALFVLTQTVRYRDFFLPVAQGEAAKDAHAPPPTVRATLVSLGLLRAALTAVIGLAKTVLPVIDTPNASTKPPIPESSRSPDQRGSTNPKKSPKSQPPNSCRYRSA